MATTTQFNEKYADEYGIERANLDDPGFIDKYRRRWGWFDHLMLMNERYTSIGGNQFAAGITYFSVLSMFPLLMIVFAVAATVLASRPDLLGQINNQLTTSIGGELGKPSTTSSSPRLTSADRSMAWGGGYRTMDPALTG